MGTCSFDECERDGATADGYCHGHDRQRRRGQPLRALRFYGQPLTRLYEASLRYYEADEDDDYRDAAERLRKAALAYAWHVLVSRMPAPRLSWLRSTLLR